MSKFRVVLTLSTEIEVSDDLLQEVMTPEWQRDMYRFASENEAVEHLAYNLVQSRTLTSLDGFAHRTERDAFIVGLIEGVESEVERVEDE